MKKSITTTLATMGLLTSANLSAADDLSSMFSEGKASGQIRLFSIDRTYQGSAGTTTHRNGTTLGGHLKYETDDFAGLNLGTAFYTVNLLASSPTIEPAIVGPDNGNYNILGEAYLQYKRGNTTFKAGRQKLDTPLASSDDARTLGNLFEAYVLVNKDLPDTTIVAGHITKFAQGTFGRVYDGGLLAVTSGYSLVDTRDQAGGFVNMGAYALGHDKATDGVSVASVTYTGMENLKVQLWDYYAHDILNAVYGELNYSIPSDIVSTYIGAQFIKENDVDDQYAGDVNGLYGAVKVGAKFANLNVYGAYSQTSKNSASDTATANAIISPWGGMPAYTQGMVTRHQFMAGTKAYKVSGVYNWKEFGPKVTSAVYYTAFDMDANSGYGIERTATEAGFDVIYYPEMVKNLQLRFRGNFPRKFAESTSGDTGWNEYRFIVNYNF
ncbi:MAG: OprD family outer membrane porin [Sulfurimonas sp.]